MNQWPECIDIWHGRYLGQGDSRLFNWRPYGHKMAPP